MNKAGQPRERFEALRDEDFREWVREQPCVIANKDCWYFRRDDGTKFSDAAHVESKARGTGDAANLVPLCRCHHREQHTFGQRSFEREHDLKLRQIAGEVWLKYEAERVGHGI